MAFHDDLLQLALDLVHKNRAAPKQADLRRSISTAYYALFHLLISETIAHWSLASSRDALSRMFEHSVMRRVSVKLSNRRISPFVGEDPTVVQNLRNLAEDFVHLQDKRHVADYDNTVFWSPAQAIEEVTIGIEAFSTWQSIKNEKIAQDFLVSLLIKPRD